MVVVYLLLLYNKVYASDYTMISRVNLCTKSCACSGETIAATVFLFKRPVL